MISSVNEEMVLIKPDAIQEKSEGGLELPEEAKAKMQRSQNRGTVELTGSKVTWPEKGMYVSFYRAAATDLPEGDNNFVILHHAHCLAEISSK